MDFLTVYLNEIDKILSDSTMLSIFIPEDGKYATLNSNNFSIDTNDSITHFSLKSAATGTIVATFGLAQMPGCCGICVSTASYVNPRFRNLGIGTKLNIIRMIMARELGYTVLMCTDVDSNQPQKKILNRNGWEQIHSFVNQRTNNDVNISVVNLLEI